MFYQNPLEPRIPVRPPWAEYAEINSGWVATPGIYVTPFWNLAASFAGGQALSRSKVVSDTQITIDPAVVIAIDSSRISVQTDPDAAYIINQAYNAFRLEIVRGLTDYPNIENFEKSFSKRVAPWMLTHINGLYQLLMTYIEDEPDIDKPFVMISKFAGKQAAFEWFSQMTERRGTKVPVPYLELSPEFVGFATKMYYIPDSVSLTEILEIVGVAASDAKPFGVLYRSDKLFGTPIFHGTTLSAITAAFPEASLDGLVLQDLTVVWRNFVIEQDRQMGENLAEMMRAMAQHYRRSED